MPFDPCREWLGIDAVDLGDPHRVLGIPGFANTPATINAAAEARLATLQEIDPGPFGRAREALVARIEEARQALLQEAGPAVPPPPSWRAPPPPAAWQAGPASNQAPVLGTPPFAQSHEASSDAAISEPEELPPGLPTVGTKRAKAARRRRGSSGDLTGALLGLVAVLLAVAAAVIAAVLTQRPSHPVPGGQVAVAPQPTPPQPTPKPKPKPNPKPTPAPVTQPQPQPASVPEPESEPAADLAPTPAPDPAPTPPPPPAVDDDARVRMEEAVDSALREAYKALQRQEFDTADRAITAASRQIGDDVEAATRVERWRLLATYARSFTGYREQAFEAANAGREYDLGNTRFSLIEITPEKFVYKIDGKIERVAADRVDPRIVLAIVEAWFAADGRAANHLFLGAQAFCLDPPDLRRARGEWQRAGQGGEQVSPLLALLEDPVIRRAGGR